MFFTITIIISLLGLLTATYTDLKERIVPNKLNFALAGIGLFIYAAQSIFVQSPLPFIYSLWGLLFGFFFAWLLWKGGVFAGGDVKLFMALGALNPFTPALLKIGLLTNNPFNVFPITLFLYSTLSFLPYGMIVIIFRLAKNKKFQKKLWKDFKVKIKQGIHFAFFSAGVYTILQTYSINPWVTLVAILVWGLMKEYKLIATIIVFLGALILNPILVGTNFATTLLIVVVGYTLIKLMFSMRPLLSRTINVKDLEEGMIPTNTLVWKDKKVVEVEAISFGQIMNYAKKRKLNEILNPGKEIISARKARGLIEEELKEIKKLARTGKIPKTIMVKDTLPFVPTILLGYIACLLLGDAWLILMGGF